ncbi:hypothetical protein SAMN05216245_11038 [Succiniclasticum ruminis DSM 9236]|jgi:hypothetical protein|uniref:Uncharacterized protein n=1 Tax=Succiniclasticum ruminis DSM 9236 TaxID=1123323 RepID=A0A1I2BWQ1_9FIRM|nr:hypothetical protein SAMN05216245_11038 [Succiniclasticum ruminis DSM 9236]
MNVYEFMHQLKLCKKYLTPQQYRTLKGQAVKGNVAEAEKGLQRLLRKEQREVHTWHSRCNRCQ